MSVIPIVTIPVRQSQDGLSNLARARYYIRAIQVICECLDIGPEELLPGRLAHWWQAWEAHPQYEAFYQPYHSGFAPAFDILKPQVMGVWRHEPGRSGRTESYVSGTPADVLASMKFGNRTYGGRFICFQPILPEAPPGKPHRHLVLQL